MKKILVIFLILIFLILVAVFFAWTNRTHIAAHYLSKTLNGVPVSIEKIDYKNDTLMIDNFHVGNPKGSKTKTAFAAKNLDIQARLKEIRGKELVIQAIDLSDILIGLEYYNASQTQSNWQKILENKSKKKKNSDRNYLIKKLTLSNLTIVVTSYDGKITRYPTIDYMEFYNISDETGFPVEEIEKAVFDIMMKRILREYGIKAIQQAIEQLAPQLPGVPFFGG